jgi:hypothetical protein
LASRGDPIKDLHTGATYHVAGIKVDPTELAAHRSPAIS